MILVQKKDADFILRFIALARPVLPLLFFVLVAAAYMSVLNPLVLWIAAVMALLFHRITCNDWNEQE